VCTAGACDGTIRTSCNGYVGPEVSCGLASCSGGTETFAGKCDGKGACNAPPPHACGAYACGPTGCNTTCTGDSDCSQSNVCDRVSSHCVSGATCDGQHTVTAPNGTVTDCTPYNCEGSQCRTACGTVGDCAPPNVCDATGHCGPPPQASGSSGGCTFSPASHRGGIPASALLLLATLLLRGKKRQ
jgi:hypothetical protein